MIDKALFALIGKQKPKLFLATGLNILALLLNVFITYNVVTLIENLYFLRGLDTQLVIFIIIAGIARYLVSVFHYNLISHLGYEIKRTLRNQVFSKNSKFIRVEYEGINKAHLLQNASEGIEQLNTYFTVFIPQFFFAMAAPIILFVITLFFSFPAATALLLCVPIIPLSIVVISKFAKKIFAKHWTQYLGLSSYFFDSLNGMNELKIFDYDETMQKRMDGQSEEFRKVTMKVLVMQLWSLTVMDMVAFGGAGLGISVALSTTAASPFSVLFVVLVAVEFFLPLRSFGSAFHMGMNGVTAGRYILKFLNMEEPKWGSKKFTTPVDIKINDVNLEIGDTKILQNINMHLPAHKVTALVGPSGSGKSTIANLVSGLNISYLGNILINDKPINTFDRNSFYSHVHILNSSSYLFTGTVKDNFLRINEKITDKYIEGLLKELKLPFGIDYQIAENFTNISGGEKQRLCFALALATNKEVLIFDEITSNIDQESDQIIMDKIYQLDKTILLISHRIRNVIAADKIYVIDQSKIVEKGNHRDLLDKKGLYSCIYEEQAELEKGVIL